MVREHERRLQGAALRAAEHWIVQVHSEPRRPCGWWDWQAVSGRRAGRGRNLRSPRRGLWSKSTSSSAPPHPHPESKRLPGTAAPGSEFVQHARQRQGPDEFHGACRERARRGGAGRGRAGDLGTEGPGRGEGRGSARPPELTVHVREQILLLPGTG